MKKRTLLISVIVLFSLIILLILLKNLPYIINNADLCYSFPNNLFDGGKMCISNYAVKENAPNICNRLGSTDTIDPKVRWTSPWRDGTKEYCFLRVALESYNVEFCSQAGIFEVECLENFGRFPDKEETIPKNFTIEEMKYCEQDSDCVQVMNNCCAGSNCLYTSVNKNYSEYWESQFDCTNIGCTGSLCNKFFLPKCVNNQCELVKVFSKAEILEIAKNSTSANMEGVPLNDIWNIIDEEISFLDNKWYVNLTANYGFGCCSSCGPGQACATVCTSCGTKTIENNFIINNEGILINESFKEIACTESESGWWRSRELKGESCLVVEGQYTCPNYDGIDCSPGIIPEIMWYCVEPYHTWIKDNCNITFTY